MTEKKLVLELSGELDHHSAPEIKKELDKKIKQGSFESVVFDMTRLTFMDSSGIGVLLGRYNLLGGKPAFIRKPAPGIDRLLSMSGIYQIMQKEK